MDSLLCPNLKIFLTKLKNLRRILKKFILSICAKNLTVLLTITLSVGTLRKIALMSVNLLHELNLRKKKLFANLRGKLTEFVPLGNYDTAHFKAVKFAPKNTFTEKIAAEAAGLKYVRFYALDMTFPAPEVVDEYLKFLSQIDSDAWLHFHCHAGHGRTTTFLVIYDILKHPDLSLENIVQRQYSLGGSNLFENEEYEKNIRLFYEYTHENSPQSWSQWLMKRGN